MILGEEICNRASKLTPQERRVLYWLAFDKCNKEIANELGISVKTVEKHRENASCKLGTHTPIETTRAALASGVVEMNSWLANEFGPVRMVIHKRKKRRQLCV